MRNGWVVSERNWADSGKQKSLRAPDRGWGLTALRGHCSNVPERDRASVCVFFQGTGRIRLKKGAYVESAIKQREALHPVRGSITSRNKAEQTQLSGQHLIAIFTMFAQHAAAFNVGPLRAVTRLRSVSGSARRHTEHKRAHRLSGSRRPIGCRPY